MEATFQREYGIGVKDIFVMSWRRFRVLFEIVFTREEGEQEKDWNAALDRVSGRETPSHTQKMSLEEFKRM